MQRLSIQTTKDLHRRWVALRENPKPPPSKFAIEIRLFRAVGYSTELLRDY
jgi:hypothetical protein